MEGFWRESKESLIKLPYPEISNIDVDEDFIDKLNSIMGYIESFKTEEDNLGCFRMLDL